MLLKFAKKAVDLQSGSCFKALCKKVAGSLELFQYGVFQSTSDTYNARVCILGLGVLCASSG